MDQVIVLMEKHLNASKKDKLITPSMINNYVKLGIVPPPIKKKYSKILSIQILLLSLYREIKEDY